MAVMVGRGLSYEKSTRTNQGVGAGNQRESKDRWNTTRVSTKNGREAAEDEEDA